MTSPEDVAALGIAATTITQQNEQLIRQRRLVRWLSLPYGTNLPVFHGQYKEELADDYQDALSQDDGDQAFAYQAEQLTSTTVAPEFETPPGTGAYAEHERRMNDPEEYDQAHLVRGEE